MEKTPFKYTPWIPLIIGTILRVVDLGGRSLWVDEGLTAGFVSEPIPVLLAGCAVNSNPPLFYLLLWPWVRIWGLSEISLGAFSAVTGLITIYFVYLLFRQLAGQREAFLAALITAVAPFMVYSSNDCRPYSFLGMVAVIATYYFIRAIQDNRLKYWILTGIFTAACAYTHLLGWSVFLLEVAYVILAKPYRQWKIIRNLGLTLIAVLIVYIPQAFVTAQQIKILRVDDFSPVETASGGFGKLILVAAKQFLGGFYRILADYYFVDLGGRGLTSIRGWETFLFALTLIVAFGLPILILLYLFKHKPKWGLFLLLMYLIPFIQVFWEGTDPRRFTPPAPALYGALAMAYFTWKKPLRIIVIASFLIISIFSLGKMYSMTSCIVKPEDYRQVSRIIKEKRAPEDAIVFYGGSCGNQCWRFYDPGGTIFGSPEYTPQNFNIYATIRTPVIFSEAMFPVTVDSLLSGHPKVWMVVSNDYPPNYQHLVERWYNTYDIGILYTDDWLMLLEIKAMKDRMDRNVVGDR